MLLVHSRSDTFFSFFPAQLQSSCPRAGLRAPAQTYLHSRDLILSITMTSENLPLQAPTRSKKSAVEKVGENISKHTNISHAI